jgi:hypothetical protein
MGIIILFLGTLFLTLIFMNFKSQIIKKYIKKYLQVLELDLNLWQFEK